ncbi:MAG TPA: DUF2085 domain-containing protein [Polyangiaceae bacterium]|nr:DUF2085 domain-containing protein [Polyangiaceae bacterium]
MPDRSFEINGETLAVCHRCTGIYAGLAIGAFLATGIYADPARWRLWVLAVTPMVLQVVLGWIWPALDLFYLRVATGAFAGLGGGLLLASIFRPAPGKGHPAPPDRQPCEAPKDRVG